MESGWRGRKAKCGVAFKLLTWCCTILGGHFFSGCSHRDHSSCSIPPMNITTIKITTTSHCCFQLSNLRFVFNPPPTPCPTHQSSHHPFHSPVFHARDPTYVSTDPSMHICTQGRRRSPTLPTSPREYRQEAMRHGNLLQSVPPLPAPILQKSPVSAHPPLWWNLA